MLRGASSQLWCVCASCTDSDEPHGIAIASLIDNRIDETERGTWLLFEAARREDAALRYSVHPGQHASRLQSARPAGARRP